MIDATTFWDKSAVKYAQKPIEDMNAYRATLDRTRSYLGDDDRVLEVGCGTGTTALYLCESVTSYLGTDISTTMIEIAQQKARSQEAVNAEFKTASVGDISAADGPFDAVLAFNLIHLLPNPDEDLGKIGSLLRPGGVFISKTFCSSGAGLPLKYRLIKLALPLMQAIGKAPFVRFETESDLQDRIRAQGFEIMETRHFGASTSTPFIVARKTA